MEGLEGKVVAHSSQFFLHPSTATQTTPLIISSNLWYIQWILSIPRTWRCILLLPLVGYVTNTQPHLKSVPPTVSPVSGTQWKQSHRPDASNVFPQWNTQLSLWRSAIKIPDFCLEPATMFTDEHLEFGMIEIESAQCN